MKLLLRKRAIASLEVVEVPIDHFESLDNALERLRKVDILLRASTERMSEEHLTKLIEPGSLSDLRKVMSEVNSFIEEINREMKRAGEIIDSV